MVTVKKAYDTTEVYKINLNTLLPYRRTTRNPIWSTKVCLRLVTNFNNKNENCLMLHTNLVRGRLKVLIENY